MGTDRSFQNVKREEPPAFLRIFENRHTRPAMAHNNQRKFAKHVHIMAPDTAAGGATSTSTSSSSSSSSSRGDEAPPAVSFRGIYRRDEDPVYWQKATSEFDNFIPRFTAKAEAIKFMEVRHDVFWIKYCMPCMLLIYHVRSFSFSPSPSLTPSSLTPLTPPQRMRI